MSVYNDIRLRITVCQKGKLDVERDVLRTVLGEAQTISSRAGRAEPTDEDVLATLKKSKEGVEQNLLLIKKACPETDKMQDEIEIYNRFLPHYAELEYIIDFLKQEPHKTALDTASSDGQATGIAMKVLKQQRLPVLGKDVSVAVKKVRDDAKAYRDLLAKAVEDPKDEISKIT